MAGIRCTPDELICTGLGVFSEYRKYEIIMYMYIRTMYMHSTKNMHTTIFSHREGEAVQSTFHVNDDMGREISAGLSPSELHLNMNVS